MFGVLFTRVQNQEKILFPAVKVLCLVIGSYYVIKILGEQFGFASLAIWLKPFKDSIIAISFAWILYRLKQDVLKTHQVVTQDFFPAVSKIGSIALFILTVLVILRIFKLDIIPLLAFGGIGAAALGFAAKDVISSFFGGMLLSITRPFSLGDLILLQGKEIEGYVEEIGWCLTVIRDKDKRAVYLPNSLFPHTVVVNASRRTGRRVLETVHIRFGDFDKMTSIINSLKESLIKSSLVDKESPILVFVSEIGAYSLEFTLDFYTLETSWKDYVLVKEQVLQLVFSTIEKQGAHVAFPVSLSQEPIL